MNVMPRNQMDITVFSASRLRLSSFRFVSSDRVLQVTGRYLDTISDVSLASPFLDPSVTGENIFEREKNLQNQTISFLDSARLLADNYQHLYEMASPEKILAHVVSREQYLSYKSPGTVEEALRTLSNYRTAVEQFGNLWKVLDIAGPT